jgi:hypothetical protein
MLSISLRVFSAPLFLALMCLMPAWPRDIYAAELNAVTPRNDSSVQVEKPQIPTENFEWNGTFRVPGETVPVVTDLTIRGMWQKGYFNLYMEQGLEGGEYWVENLIYQNHLYTLTHNWPNVGPPVSGFCYKSLNEVTVAGLNGVLESAQLVGLETIDGTPMNHFRASCLSKSQILGLPLPAVAVNIFSDIYVQPDSPQQFERWLQFGDAVGLSKQHDEWFFFDEQNNHPQPIQLPPQCTSFRFLMLQAPCSNLTN